MRLFELENQVNENDWLKKNNSNLEMILKVFKVDNLNFEKIWELTLILMVNFFFNPIIFY